MKQDEIENEEKSDETGSKMQMTNKEVYKEDHSIKMPKFKAYVLSIQYRQRLNYKANKGRY